MQFPLDLTASNVSSLIKGRPIQLRKEQLNGSKHHLIVHPTTHRRMSIAKSKGKGLRVQLTPEEVKASGEGFREFWNKIKSVGNWVKQNIIDTPLYQSAVKPIVKDVVSAATTAATPFLGPAAPLAKQGVEKLGEITGAYGLVMPTAKTVRSTKGRKSKAVAQNPMPVVIAKPKPKPKPKPKAKAGSIFIQ